MNEAVIANLLLSNCCTLLIGIVLAILTYLLGRWQAKVNYKREKEQHEKELQLLTAQLEEQKRQNELNERIYKEQNQPKMTLPKWNIKD